MTTTDKTHSIGIWSGIISGLTYGIYTTLVMVAGYYEPLTLAVGLLAAPYVCSGLMIYLQEFGFPSITQREENWQRYGSA